MGEFSHVVVQVSYIQSTPIFAGMVCSACDSQTAAAVPFPLSIKIRYCRVLRALHQNSLLKIPLLLRTTRCFECLCLWYYSTECSLNTYTWCATKQRKTKHGHIKEEREAKRDPDGSFSAHLVQSQKEIKHRN